MTGHELAHQLHDYYTVLNALGVVVYGSFMATFLYPSNLSYFEFKGKLVRLRG